MHIPGKTFLVGEYAVLVGGEALGLGTLPAFTTGQDVTKYHHDSAVGLFNQKHAFHFQTEILNPYQIKNTEGLIPVGGFGQSTAEFIFAYRQKYQKFSLKTIFDDYLALYMDPQYITQQPSGADLVTQLLGGVTHFARPVENSQSYTWPFKKLSFCVISAVEKTGTKVKTHEHLQNLNRAQLLDLPTLSQTVIESFKNKEESVFLKNLSDWVESLTQKKLICESSLQIKAELEKIESVKLVKPCGALGADVLLVFSSKELTQITQSELRQRGFTTLATEDSLTAGALI